MIPLVKFWCNVNEEYPQFFGKDFIIWHHFLALWVTDFLHIVEAGKLSRLNAEAAVTLYCLLFSQTLKRLIKIKTASLFSLVFIFLKEFVYLFLRDGGREGEREGRSINVRKSSIGCLLYAPHPGTKPATQACALTGNRTGNLLLCGVTSNQVSHTGPGLTNFLINNYFHKVIYIDM